MIKTMNDYGTRTATVQCTINFDFHSGDKPLLSKWKEAVTENFSELFRNPVILNKTLLVRCETTEKRATQKLR